MASVKDEKSLLKDIEAIDSQISKLKESLIESYNSSRIRIELGWMEELKKNKLKQLK